MLLGGGPLELAIAMPRPVAADPALEPARAPSGARRDLEAHPNRIFTTTTLSEQNYTLSRTTLSGAELHFEQNYTLSRTTPKIQFSKM